MKKILFTSLFALLFLGISRAAISQEIGMASYYADKFQGRKTASGEKYDRKKLTCAHNTYPFGTMLKVTRLDNQKSVVVRVNDRGPHVSGRIVDLSLAAAEKIGLTKDGITKVKVEVYEPATVEKTEPKPKKDQKQNSTKSNPKDKKPTPYSSGSETPQAKTEKASTNKDTPKKGKKVTQPPKTGSTTPRTKTSTPRNKPITPQTYREGNGLYNIQITQSKGGFATQVGSYTDFNNTMRAIADLQAKGFTNILLKMETPPNSPTKYKILLGLRDNRESAEVYRKNLLKKYKIKGFVTEVRP